MKQFLTESCRKDPKSATEICNEVVIRPHADWKLYNWIRLLEITNPNCDCNFSRRESWREKVAVLATSVFGQRNDNIGCLEQVRGPSQAHHMGVLVLIQHAHIVELHIQVLVY